MSIETITDNLIAQVQTVTEIDLVSKTSIQPVVTNRLSVLFTPHSIEHSVTVSGNGLKQLKHRYTIPCEIWLRHNQESIETNYETMRNMGGEIIKAILAGDSKDTYYVDVDRQITYQVLDGLVRADTNLIWFGADIRIPIMEFECI